MHSLTNEEGLVRKEVCNYAQKSERRQHHNSCVVYWPTVMKSDSFNVPKFLFKLSANSFSTTATSLWLFSTFQFTEPSLRDC